MSDEQKATPSAEVASDPAKDVAIKDVATKETATKKSTKAEVAEAASSASSHITEVNVVADGAPGAMNVHPDDIAPSPGDDEPDLSHLDKPDSELSEADLINRYGEFEVLVNRPSSEMVTVTYVGPVPRIESAGYIWERMVPVQVPLATWNAVKRAGQFLKRG